MLQLLKAHREGNSSLEDIVSGKGKGLIGLLQGPPGSGKTLTAEVIAETAQMPLYVISSGSLGNNASSICEKLSRVLGLAAHWNAVLLLEEADVFLAKRQISDLERNSMVSVFLRELEYYQGILLLTTNHLEMMDEAFESRIHFSYNYLSPDLASRRQIWDLLLRNAAKSGTVKVELDEEGREILAKMPLNGRQIKNIVGVAMKLCNGEDSITAEKLQAAVQLMPRFRVGDGTGQASDGT
jgi:SpoVK/Ycf46/Vps4 family AAA+-type ATPase